MPDIERLYQALDNADKAGDVEAARDLANWIRSEERIASGVSERRPTEAAAAPEPSAPQFDTTTPGRTRLLSAANVPLFGQQIGALMRANAGGVATDYGAERGGATPGDYDYLNDYRRQRDVIKAGLEEGQAFYPDEALQGTALGIAGQVLAPNPGALKAIPSMLKNAPQALKLLPNTLRGLATKEGAKGVGKGVGAGAGFGGLNALSQGEADLTRGEFGKAGEEALAGATDPLALILGGTLGGLPAGRSAGRKLLERKAVKLEGQAAKAKGVETFEADSKTLDARKAEAAAANKADQVEYKAAVAKAKEDAEVANLRAKEAADAGNAQREAAALAEARRPTKDKSIILTGLKPKIKSRGSEKTKTDADAVFDEPLDPGGKPGSLLERAMEMDPPQRLKMAEAKLKESGEKLGNVRAALGYANKPTRVDDIRNAVRSEFKVDLGEEQSKALSSLDDILVELSDDAANMSTRQLRTAIEEVDKGAKFSSKAGFNSAARVYRSAREKLVAREKQLIAETFPDEAANYTAELKRNQVLRDFRDGSEELNKTFRGVDPTRDPVKYPKPQDFERLVAEKIKPAKVPKPVKREVKAPEYPGGPEQLAKDRAGLGPSAGVKLAARTGGRALGAMLGGMKGRPFVGMNVGKEVADAVLGRLPRQTSAGLLSRAQTARRGAAAPSSAPLNLVALLQAFPQLREALLRNNQ